MIIKSKRKIAAAFVATIFASLLLSSCEGRKMSNMTPTGDTVEVAVTEVTDTLTTE